MPLCFLRGLCYSPTKTLSELFLTMSPSLCVAHALSLPLSPPCSLSLSLFFVVESGLLCIVSIYNVAWVTMKSFYSPVPQMHIKRLFTGTPCVITQHTHIHTQTHTLNTHTLFIHLQTSPLPELSTSPIFCASSSVIFLNTLIVEPRGSPKTHTV